MTRAHTSACNALQAAEGQVTQLQAHAAALARALEVREQQLGQALASLEVSGLTDWLTR